MMSIDEFVASRKQNRGFALTRANVGAESDEEFHRFAEELISAPEDHRFIIAGYHRNGAGFYAIVYCEPAPIALTSPRR